MTTNWELECRQQLSTALLGCACVNDKDTRNNVVDDLPVAIKNAIKRNDAPHIDVVNILKTCQHHLNGLQQLLDVIESYEQGSFPYQRVKQVYINVNLCQICNDLEEPLLHQAFNASLPRHTPDRAIRGDQKGHILWGMLDHLWEFLPQNPDPLLTFADYLRQQCEPVAATKLHKWQAQVAKQLGLPIPSTQALPSPKPAESLYLQIILRPDDNNINRTGAARELPHYISLWLWQGTRHECLHQDSTATARPFMAVLQLLQQALKAINSRYPQQTTPLTVEFVLPRQLLLEAVEHETIPSPIGSGRKMGKYYNVVVRSWERLEYPDLWDTWRRRWHGFSQSAAASQLCSQPNEDWTEFFEALPDKTTMLGVAFVPPATVTDPDFFYQLLNAGVPVAIWPRRVPDDITELTQRLEILLNHQRVAELPALFYEERKQAKGSHVMNDLTLLWDCCDRILELPTMS